MTDLPTYDEAAAFLDSAAATFDAWRSVTYPHYYESDYPGDENVDFKRLREVKRVAVRVAASVGMDAEEIAKRAGSHVNNVRKFLAEDVSDT